ncbi:ATP-binding protein [Puniceicoccaceae bacterium K14]|nr:ATP-binding protein [Puniceicoccaceae bacterium K14]
MRTLIWQRFAQAAPLLFSNTSLADAAKLLSELDLDFLAIADKGKIIGLCSRLSVNNLLGKRFGHDVLGRSPIKKYMEDGEVIINLKQPLVEICNQTLTRSSRFFHHDVIALDSSGDYFGLLKASDLARLQNELVEEKMLHLNRRKAELEEANRKLHEMADQLRNSNRKLEIARDQGLQAARAKSEFLAVMSHEIRTPLNGVIGMLDLLSYSKLNEEQDDLAKAATDSSHALLSILNDILDFSRLDSGSIELESEDFDIRKLGESVISLMAESANESQIEIHCDIALDVPRVVNGDSSRLRQVIANLVGNAVKFTKSGEVCLRIVFSRNDENASKIRIEVSDTGIGISEDAQAKLFQPFVQADSSTTRKFGGTGLGLAICQKLVKVMGGNIDLKSELGIGSTFGFDLPLAQANGSCDGYRPQKIEGNSKAIVFLPKSRETDIIVRELRIRGLEVVVCGSGIQANESITFGSNSKHVIIAQEGCQPECECLSKHRVPRILLRPSHSCPKDNVEDGVAYIRRPFRTSLLDRALNRLLRKPEGSLLTKKKGPVFDASLNEANLAHPPKLLLVEDHHINRKLLVKVLHKIGYECDVAEDGLEALENCQKNRYDLILLDCQMPRMDGYEFAKNLRNLERKDPSRGASHIVALTANAMSGDRELCLAAGMDDYVSKPVNQEKLKTALVRGLSLQHASA